MSVFINFSWCIVSLFVVLCLNIEIISSISGPKHGKLVVCYIGSWSVYRPGRGSFEIEHVDPSLCTHLVYAFAGLNVQHDSIRSLDPWQDLTEGGGKAGYKRIVSLKQSYPHLKITLALGGWNEGSANYSALVSDPIRRKRFVANTVDFIRQYNFDGLDLDWEFPGERGGSPNDKLNFLLLVQELRSAFNKFNFLLTAAFGSGKKTIDAAYDVKSLSYYLDYIHLMCYDYHGTWDKKTGANAPLRSSDVLSVEYTLQYMVKLGASPEKMILGIPLYGRTFVLENSASKPRVKQNKLGEISKEEGFQGVYTRQNGFMGYNEICLELQNISAAYAINFDQESKTPFAMSGSKVISYDDENSIFEKIKLALQNNLGGAMVWSIDTDDFHGDCNKENFPLMRSIDRAIEQISEDLKREKENSIDHDEKFNKGGSARKYTIHFCVLTTVFWLYFV